MPKNISREIPENTMVDRPSFLSTLTVWQTYLAKGQSIPQLESLARDLRKELPQYANAEQVSGHLQNIGEMINDAIQLERKNQSIINASLQGEPARKDRQADKLHEKEQKKHRERREEARAHDILGSKRDKPRKPRKF